MRKLPNEKPKYQMEFLSKAKLWLFEQSQIAIAVSIPSSNCYFAAPDKVAIYTIWKEGGQALNSTSELHIAAA